MKWWRKRAPSTRGSDVGEAREMREQAKEEYRVAVSDGIAVAQLAAVLAERRALNHFGESIQITFTRRGRRA